MEGRRGRNRRPNLVEWRGEAEGWCERQRQNA